jgi:hypothetical protein
MYDYVIRPLPDAYIAIKSGAKGKGSRKRYLLDVFEDDIPFFVLIRRIKKYIQFSEDNDWPNDTIPPILMVTQSQRRQKQLARRIAKELNNAYMDEDDIVFATSTLEAITTAETAKDKIWQLADEEKTMKVLSAILTIVNPS